MFLCFCVPLQKNKNVRDPFASVTGRRRALPPPGSAGAGQAGQGARTPSGSPAPSGYLHPADHLHPVALIHWVCLALSHCHTLPAGVQGAGV
jgi:hypothetical protein